MIVDTEEVRTASEYAISIAARNLIRYNFGSVGVEKNTDSELKFMD